MDKEIIIAAIAALPPTITALGAFIKTNAGIKKEIGELKTAFADHQKENEDYVAEQWRVRILRFDDDLCDPNRQYPSKANFQQAMADCDKYEKYIDTHDDFQNGIGEAAISHIRVTYAKCQAEQLFGKEKNIL